MAKEVVKDAVAGASGFLVGSAVFEATGSKILSGIAGIGAALFTNSGLNKMLDKPTNVSTPLESKPTNDTIVNEGGSKTEIVLPNKPHTNGTEGHWETIVNKIDSMAESEEYKKIYSNKGLSNEIPGAKPNRRPDIMGVRHDGIIDQFEIPSKTDDPAALLERMIENQKILGDRAGSVQIIPVKK